MNEKETTLWTKINYNLLFYFNQLNACINQAVAQPAQSQKDALVTISALEQVLQN